MKRALQILFGGVLRRPFHRVGASIRGRVHKISIVAGGEVSIVIRCGLDEPRARQLMQGALIELFETREGIPALKSDMTLGTPPEGGGEGTVEFVDLGKVSETGKPSDNGTGEPRG